MERKTTYDFINKQLITNMSIHDYTIFEDRQSEGAEYVDVNMIPSSCGRYVYHLALIDYLQTYDMSKKCERLAKICSLCFNKKYRFRDRNLLSVIKPS